MREKALAISIQESVDPDGGREKGSNQPEHQAKHPYGTEPEGEIGEYNGLVVLEYLAEYRVHGQVQETAAHMSDRRVQPDGGYMVQAGPAQDAAEQRR